MGREQHLKCNGHHTDLLNYNPDRGYVAYSRHPFCEMTAKYVTYEFKELEVWNKILDDFLHCDSFLKRFMLGGLQSGKQYFLPSLSELRGVVFLISYA
jgi:hypothetical protein